MVLCQIEKVIMINEERQRLLEIDYALSQIKVIKYTKLITKRFIGRFLEY